MKPIQKLIYWVEIKNHLKSEQDPTGHVFIKVVSQLDLNNSGNVT